MIDKLKEAINNCIPELDTIKKEYVIELIEHHWFNEPKQIQMWLGNEDTVPMKLGVYDDIEEIKIPINNFGKGMEITFEEI